MAVTATDLGWLARVEISARGRRGLSQPGFWTHDLARAGVMHARRRAECPILTRPRRRRWQGLKKTSERAKCLLRSRWALTRLWAERACSPSCGKTGGAHAGAGSAQCLYGGRERSKCSLRRASRSLAGTSVATGPAKREASFRWP